MALDGSNNYKEKSAARFTRMILDPNNEKKITAMANA